jgi:hypothetical protein
LDLGTGRDVRNPLILIELSSNSKRREKPVRSQFCFSHVKTETVDLGPGPTLLPLWLGPPWLDPIGLRNKGR